MFSGSPRSRRTRHWRATDSREGGQKGVRASSCVGRMGRSPRPIAVFGGCGARWRCLLHQNQWEDAFMNFSTPEGVALALFVLIAISTEPTEGIPRAAWLLDLYADCLRAAQGMREK